MSAGDGGAAFPTSIEVTSEGQTVQLPHPGMSLLDWFAGQAMAALLASPEVVERLSVEASEDGLLFGEHVAKTAYKFASSMLSERGRGG